MRTCRARSATSRQLGRTASRMLIPVTVRPSSGRAPSCGFRRHCDRPAHRHSQWSGGHRAVARSRHRGAAEGVRRQVLGTVDDDQSRSASSGYGASITLVSAISARASMPGTAGLAAVNAAVEGVVKPLAVELAPIRVNAVSPGLVNTPWWSAMPEPDREAYFAAAAKVFQRVRLPLPTKWQTPWCWPRLIRASPARCWRSTAAQGLSASADRAARPGAAAAATSWRQPIRP